ncbi:MAG: type II toxin-antitoxin system HicA family toxin [Planctomycetota bacterium]
MSKLPAASGRDVIRALQLVGFEVARTVGSHHVLKKSGHAYVVTVPVHGNKSLKPGTLRRLIRDAGLSVDEFVIALRE